MKRRQVSTAALPAIGQPFAGGFYAGRIYFEGTEFALIDAGRDFETTAHWWDQEGPRPRIRGSQHRYDGMANTKAMAEEGSAIARKVLGMNVRGSWGWHIPSIEELNILRSNLLQLEDWGRQGGLGNDKDASNAFACTHTYWSSTQREGSATAWCMHMLPWSYPDSNWVSQEKGIRPVKVLQIKADAFVHDPASDARIVDRIAQADLQGLTASPAVAEVLGHFINEDTGRFYGRTDDLLAQLAMITGETRP